MARKIGEGSAHPESYSERQVYAPEELIAFLEKLPKGEAASHKAAIDLLSGMNGRGVKGSDVTQYLGALDTGKFFEQYKSNSEVK